MKIALVSGSPKPKTSASKIILAALGQYIGGKGAITQRHISEQDTRERIAEADAVVLAFPLYVDGVPSHLLAAMELMEKEKTLRPDTRVFAVVNCGFIEGIQCETAIAIARHWCERCGARWGGAIGFGGGGGFDMMEAVPMGYGPKKSLGKALEKLAGCIADGTEYGEKYLSVDFPGFMYKIGAHSYWRGRARANGLKKKELGRKPSEQ